MTPKITIQSLIYALGNQQTNHSLEHSTKVKAAVLVPIIDSPNGLQLLFTRRTNLIKSHPGQISFPGGRVEANDSSLEATALRETYEEVGLPPDQVTVIGRLPESETLSGDGYLVTPVVGILSPPLTLSADPIEVAEIFEVPLEFLLNPRHQQQRYQQWQGQWLDFYVINYKGYSIWGLTAKIVVGLSEILKTVIK
jgi:8-oxo-dGTP pyrophosphatase MutT (NUDIX family)